MYTTGAGDADTGEFDNDGDVFVEVFEPELVLELLDAGGVVTAGGAATAGGVVTTTGNAVGTTRTRAGTKDPSCEPVIAVTSIQYVTPGVRFSKSQVLGLLT